MSYYGPTSLDMLTTQGILPMDAQAYLTGEPSEYLSRYGIITPPDPSLKLDANTLQRQPKKDDFSPEAIRAEIDNNTQTPIVDQYDVNKMTESDKPILQQPANWKKIGAGALGVYLLGFILSGFKKNPIRWGEPLGKLCVGAKNLICNMFKTS